MERDLPPGEIMVLNSEWGRGAVTQWGRGRVGAAGEPAFLRVCPSTACEPPCPPTHPPTHHPPITHTAHQLPHMPSQLLKFGPGSDWWEFPHESFLGLCKSEGVQNRTHTEASIASRYTLYLMIDVLRALCQVRAGKQGWEMSRRGAADEGLRRAGRWAGCGGGRAGSGRRQGARPPATTTS